MKIRYLSLPLCLSTFIFSSSAFAIYPQSFYVAVDAGIFTGSFNTTYLDQTLTIPQNIAQLSEQHGYSEGLALGFNQIFRQKYLLGAEVSGYLDSHTASFQSGASTSAFSDSVQINNHFDLVLVPGLLLNESIIAYLKLGAAYASLQDSVNSPVGFNPVMTNFNSNKNSVGFVAGIGVKKFITDHLAVFTEADYHDYGTVTFANFQNFSVNYSHTSHVYSYALMLGAAYHF